MTADNIPASGTLDAGAKGPARIVFVVARSDNGIIGRDGKLPWHISADLQHFKRLTVGKPVVMGRRTFESIGKPLPRRTNIVVTRDAAWQHPGVQVVHDIPSALALAYEDAHRTGADEVSVIGGGEVFQALMPEARRIYLTEVHGSFQGDAVFDLDLALGWREVSRERHAAETPGGPDFSFVTLERTT
jgi:dihydrofolate reductase